MFSDPSYILSESELVFLQAIQISSSRLASGIMLKNLQLNGYFPKSVHDVANDLVNSIANQLDLNSKKWLLYDLDGRSTRRYKLEIKKMTGFKSPTKAEYKELLVWIHEKTNVGDAREEITAAIYNRLIAKKIIFPENKIIDDLVTTTIEKVETSFFKKMVKSLPVDCRDKIDQLLDAKNSINISQIKQDPGQIGVKSLKNEAEKLALLKKLKIPNELLDTTSKAYLSTLKRRVSSESIFEINRHPFYIKYALMAIFAYVRTKEITDDLVDLLNLLVHKIDTKAEKRATNQLFKSFKKVRNKNDILCDILDASLEHPEDKIKKIIYPLAGGEEAIRNIVKEIRATTPIYKITVREFKRKSYLHHYRQMIPIILECLDFKSNNTKHEPIIDGIELIKKYYDTNVINFPDYDKVPQADIIKPDNRAFVIQNNSINKVNYEIVLLEALRNRLRCKEIWVDRALKYGNPDEDLPKNFKSKRREYFKKLGIEPSAKRFVKNLEGELREALQMLDTKMATNEHVKIIQKNGKSWISVSPIEAQQEPQNLQDLKMSVMQRWPMTGLLDILKETELRVGFSQCFETIGVRETISPDILQKRLMLTLFGIATNMGLKRVCTATSGENMNDLAYIKRKFVSRDNLRNAIAMVVNETLKIRTKRIWGDSTTACASDSKKFSSWDQNLLTEWHTRYHGRGVMIYWHVDKKSLCVFSQLKSCSSSEVSAMIQGLLSHNTDADINKNYVDSHGQSEVAFAFCHFLGFQLMPRLKGIGLQKLYLPRSGELQNYKNIKDVLNVSNPIKWDRIINQYDEMVKHVAALKMSYADAETILKRFTRNNMKHPTYLAFKELGRVIKTIFLCQYLSSREMRLEINEGLNVVENWNSANTFIFYGKSSEISSNNIAEQELSILSLHLLQISLVYVNTIMIQQIIKDQNWLDIASEEDLRAISPLIYSHINPYGTFNLDMNKRLNIDC